VDVDDAAAFADLLGQRVDLDERIRAGVQGPVAERGDLLVQVLGHRTDLGLRQLGDAEGLGELLDPAGGDAEQVGGGHHGDQGLLGPAAAFEEPVREVAALAQLGDGEFDGPCAGVPLAWAVSTAPGQASAQLREPLLLLGRQLRPTTWLSLPLESTPDFIAVEGDARRDVGQVAVGVDQSATR